MTVVAKLDGDTVKKMIGYTDEKLKYMKCWEGDQYRHRSPGQFCVDMFLEAWQQMGGEKGQTLIDWGCGTGRAARLLDEHFDVTPMDFAPNCLDEEHAEYFGDRFVEHDITKRTPLHADWGFCTDVMEHLPPEQIDDALQTILSSCDIAFFQIANFHDYNNTHHIFETDLEELEDHLHLTVWEYDQWLRKFSDHGVIVFRSLDQPHHSIFIVSGYKGFIFDQMKMNTHPEVVYRQVKKNYERGLQQVEPCEEQPDQKVIVLGSGPSLNDYVDEIKEHKKNGAKIVTMNGSYQWAKEHDLWPVTQFMIDARPFNERFVEEISEDNLYLIAAQVHPDIVDKLPPERTFVFNANLNENFLNLCADVLGTIYEDWWPIPGGSTVMLRALPTLQMLGFRDIEIYGFDSCLMGHDLPEGDADGSQHHAFDQPENSDDGEIVMYVTINGKRFAVTPWMLCQANEYLNMSKIVLKAMDIKIHGNGLIAHCVETNAERLEGEN